MTNSGSAVNSILQELEWDDGLAIPVANDKNKYLISLVEQLQKEILHEKHETEHFDDKVIALETHIKNVRQEFQHTQGLLQARQHEIESEGHLQKISEREDGRLKQELQRINKEINEGKQKKHVMENTIFKQTAQLEEMKAQMNWNQQALEAWLEESEKKTEDALALEKYSRQDEGKIRELSLQLERLTEERNAKKHKLDNIVIDTQTAQVELDKTAEQFRGAHKERQDLIHQWEETIKQMERRDKEIEFAAAHLAKVKQTCREKEEQIKEKQGFLDAQIQGNKEVEQKIGMAERLAAQTRFEYQEAEQQRSNFQNELNALKRTVDRTNVDLEAARSQVTQLKKEAIAKANNFEQIKSVREEFQDKLKKVIDSRLSSEETAQLMENLLKEEEERQNEMEKELKSLREFQFKEAQELHEARLEKKSTEATIMGSRAALRNLNSKIGKFDHDILKQQEIMYNQDFAIQQLERRIGKMGGETNNDEKNVLEIKIKELNDELEDRNDVFKKLTTQLKNLQDDIRRCKRDMDKTRVEKDDMSTKIDELNLHNDSSQRELKKIVGQKQSTMVDENIMKLEVKRLRDQLNERADQVVSQDKRKMQFDTAMKERREEISIHKEMLQAQMRAADEERQQVSSELHEREAKIDKLQKRYEILMVSMAPPEGEEEKSQAYYVIKAAQDREELQRKGDTLDAQIRKAEKECRALENTLRLMNSCNEQYRKTFTKVGDTSEETLQKEELQNQLRTVTDKYKSKRRQIREMEEELVTMKETVENLQKDEMLYTEQKQQLEQMVAQREKEKADHLAKIERANKSIIRAKGSSVAKHIEGDIDVREAREFNRRVASEMLRAAQTAGNEVASSTEMYFQQSGIPQPSGTPTPGSVASSARSSVRSSGSSVASSRASDRSQTGRSATVGKVTTIGVGLPKSPSVSGRSSGGSTPTRVRKQ